MGAVPPVMPAVGGCSAPLLLVCFAIPEEVVELSVPGFRVRTLLTGVGKVNAAFRLTDAILRERPAFVLNVGTAGTLRLAVGDIVVSNHFIDRDYEQLRLHGLDYEATTDGGVLFPKLSAAMPAQLRDKDHAVNTGDNFVTETAQLTGDVVDMEAYAEAVVCNTYGLPFVAVKCVTDVIGKNSVALWNERLSEARRALSGFFSGVNFA